mgnify:CR=1 FL=1
MSGDEALYRQYLSGDDTGLEALMKQYGDPLTMYIDGYLHDVHEAEELMLDVFAYLFTKKPRIRDRLRSVRERWGRIPYRNTWSSRLLRNTCTQIQCWDLS